jgi:hypothetical protein
LYNVGKGGGCYMHRKILLLSLISLIFLFTACSSVEVTEIMDANKFSRITAEELVKAMGDPESIEFMLIDNSVIRLTYYSGNKEQFNNERDIFKMFNIVLSSNMKKVSDTGVALRYQMISDKIADIWITGIDKKTFDVVKVTYNLKYFE